MPSAPSSVDDVVEEQGTTRPASPTSVSAVPPSSATPLLPTTLTTSLPPTTLPSTTERTADRKKAQWYYDIREPLQQYFATRLPLYRSRNLAGQYVLIWTEKATIHEQFFPDNIALYTWMVKPENKHRYLCEPQSMEFFIHPEKPAAKKDETLAAKKD